jgi:nitrogen fixation NifU-like protein
MQLESMYQQIILDHYKHPEGKGLQDPFITEVHHVNPTCGDEITLRVSGDEINGFDISYDGQGCSISQASASVMFSLISGSPYADATRTAEAFMQMMQSKGVGEFDEDELQDAIAFQGVAKFPARIKCALLGWMAYKDAASAAIAKEGTR